MATDEMRLQDGLRTSLYRLSRSALDKGSSGLSGPAPSLNDVKEQIQQLKEAGLLNHPDRFGDRALHRACTYGQVDIVKIMLESGAQPNSLNDLGESPLHRAVQCSDGTPASRRGMVDLLVSTGATLDVRDGISNATPLERAMQLGSSRESCAAALKEAMEKVQQQELSLAPRPRKASKEGKGTGTGDVEAAPAVTVGVEGGNQEEEGVEAGDSAPSAESLEANTEAPEGELQGSQADEGEHMVASPSAEAVSE